MSRTKKDKKPWLSCKWYDTKQFSYLSGQLCDGSFCQDCGYSCGDYKDEDALSLEEAAELKASYLKAYHKMQRERAEMKERVLERIACGELDRDNLSEEARKALESVSD